MLILTKENDVNTMRIFVKHTLAGATIALICLAGLAACSLSTPPPFQNSTPITIGASISTSGDFAEDGKALLRGYQLWQEAINSRGGLLGHPVQFDFLDDDSTPDKVTANYQQMIAQNRDDLVVGPYSTKLTIAASAVAAQYNYALIEGAGTAPAVFAPHYTNLFSVSLPAISYLKSFVYFILSLPKSERPKTIAYVSSDDFFTLPQINEARSLLEANGEKTALYKIWSADTTKDYTEYINLTIAAHPDVVILGTNGQGDCVAFIQAFKEHHFNPQAIIATAGPDQGGQFTGPLGGPASAEGIFVPNGGWFPEAQTFQNAQFVQEYIAKYGGVASDISADAVQAYSVGQVLEQAVNTIHSIDNAKLTQELRAGTFNTLQGPVKFAGDGENSIAVAYLFQWQEGKLLVVYPNYAAQENPEFPKNPWP
jgi:branched-chain amino acid transport system substrate-binding protein